MIDGSMRGVDADHTAFRSHGLHVACEEGAGNGVQVAARPPPAAPGLGDWTFATLTNSCHFPAASHPHVAGCLNLRGVENDDMRSWVAIRIGVALSAGLVAGLSTAGAAAADSFYQGKQLVVLVNFAQGGPTDAEGRLVARHLSRHVGGNPSVIVHNMSGSNGAVAANWLANAAAPDGLILGYFTGIASMRALADPILSPSVARLGFVAAGPGIGVAYARTDIGGAIKKPGDLLAKRDFWVGGLRSDSDRDMRLRMQLDLLRVKHQYQPGFATMADARQAFQRGEIQVLIEPITAYRGTIEPGLVASGQALPLWFDPLDDGEAFTRSPEADNLAALTFTDFLIQTKGELPKSKLFDAWRLVNQMATLFQRIVVTAPGTPEAAIESLQKALLKMADDAAFKDDAIKSIKQVPSYVAGARTAGLFRHVVEPTPEMQALIRSYADVGKPETAPAVPGKP